MILVRHVGSNEADMLNRLVNAGTKPCNSKLTRTFLAFTKKMGMCKTGEHTGEVNAQPRALPIMEMVL